MSGFDAREDSAVVWSDDLYLTPEAVHGVTVCCGVDSPLTRISFLEQAGVQDIEFFGRISGAHAQTLWEEIGAWQRRDPGVPLSDGALLVNACSGPAFAQAAALGMHGVGLLRGEFLFSVAVVPMLHRRIPGHGSVLECLVEFGEFVALGKILGVAELRAELAGRFAEVLAVAGSAFPASAPIFVRCFDYGDAYGGAQTFRGVRLLLEALPDAIVFLGEVLGEVLDRSRAQFVFAPPMVSSFAELAEFVSVLHRRGLSVTARPTSGGSPGTGLGWEVETPAAALCSGLWVDQLKAEFALEPVMLGVGTNDLTQFTLARPRRSADEAQGFDRGEFHPAVLALLARLSADCAERGVAATISGAVAEDQTFRRFARALGFGISVTPTAMTTEPLDAAASVFERSARADCLSGCGAREVARWARSDAWGSLVH